MRIILFHNDKAVGVFARTAKQENVLALLTRTVLRNPGIHINVQQVPTISDVGLPMADLRQAAALVHNLEEAQVREELVNCYEDWLEVCHAVTGKPGHLNPDELIAKIRELKS